ncbi:hypothetical protein C3K47_17215 [Solitalea longa]|uniref:DinB-like domain-containing protein n=1 Tax=Solitalea longa TaxID=2079460 RepID=A0A2S4ZYC4_9SPHI|nr:DinB family protein [Solitalea longa]POY34997.1 hypothetical protein C3K47_17215 [Solitalea longa]
MEILEINTALVEQFEQTFDAFAKQLNRFDSNNIDKQPAFGGWSAGEVAEHIIKATKGVPDESTKEPDRPYDQHVEAVKILFQDFATKLNAPAFVLPEKKKHDLSALLKDLNRNKNLHIEIIQTKDLKQVCLGYEFPRFGFFTRYEWLMFALYHVQRHTHQLKEIYESI